MLIPEELNILTEFVALVAAPWKSILKNDAFVNMNGFSIIIS